MKTRVLILLVFLVAGCGLQDYQKRMDIERRRIQEFDNEDRTLDGMIEVPTRKNKDKQEERAWPFEVFLRVPKGFETRRLEKEPPKDVKDREPGKEPSKDIYVYTGGNLLLYRYPGPPGFNLFVAAGKIGQKTKDDTFLEGEYSPEDFRRKMCLGINEFYRKEYKGYNLMLPPATKFDKDIRKPEGVKVVLPELEYEAMTIPDRPEAKEPTHFLLFFHRNGSNQIGIGFQLPKKDVTDASIRDNIDYCLRSLDITDKAAGKRQDFAANYKPRAAKKG